ncbi:MAG: hypothetical protein CG445_4, partial [Methanosaeta sp. ASM2]
SVLEGSIDIIVANPYMIKHIPGSETAAAHPAASRRGIQGAAA